MQQVRIVVGTYISLRIASVLTFGFKIKKELRVNVK